MERLQEAFISFTFIDKNPEMKLVSFIDIRSTIQVDYYVDDICSQDIAA